MMHANDEYPVKPDRDPEGHGRACKESDFAPATLRRDDTSV